MINKLLSSFPEGYEPNTAQTQILTQMHKAFEDGYKFVIVSAPTGSGKSFISKTLANASDRCTDTWDKLITSYDAFQVNQMGEYTNEEACLDEPPHGAFALTITKSLQEQYKQLFDSATLLKGKSNYPCELDNEFDVETAPCVFTTGLKQTCWMQNKCLYYNARNTALKSDFTALNYKMFLSTPNHVKHRNYIVCDEASELEGELVSQFSCNITRSKWKKAGINIPKLLSKKPSQIRQWVMDIIDDVETELRKLKDKLAKNPKLMTQSEKYKFLALRTFNMKLSLIYKTWPDCEYVAQNDDDEIKLMPLKIDTLTDTIFKYGDKIVLMSATIIDHKNFAKTLGIDKYKYIEVGSAFDPEKSPIHINTKIRLNYKNMQTSLPTVIKQVKQLCDHHKGVKGIIHTHTSYIANQIQRAVGNDPRFLFRNDEQNNEHILEMHENSSEPTILVSPSLGYGVDLKDDLARFQIIVKAPYLPLGDERIKKLFELDKNWYSNAMLCNVVQQCGRGVRNKNDFCDTYIMDGCIYDAIVRNKDKLPKHFIDRFV
jgi:Rad3-related DNA helicase